MNIFKRALSNTPQKLEILKFADKDGSYRRQASTFRDFISREPGAKFPPEADRYHLFVSFACPWAHRVLATRALKGLEKILPVSVVHWHMDDKGWRFPTAEELKEAPNSLAYGTEDHLYGFKRLRELYFKADPDYLGRFTVPVLWDKKNETIVNNESSEIIRMLYTEFNDLIDKKHAELNFYPEELQAQVDELNSWIYDNINNGVYKSGFATTQEVYDREVTNVFEHLDKVEQILKTNQEKNPQDKFLLGLQLTEADIRLYPTLVRFDCIYVQHFKCNWKMLRYDYPYIHDWLRLLYWKIPGFKETTHFDHIKYHYTKSHVQINPHGITPKGPAENILPL